MFIICLRNLIDLLETMNECCLNMALNLSKLKMTLRGLHDVKRESDARVATVREKVLENEKFSRSGKTQGITFSVREI